MSEIKKNDKFIKNGEVTNVKDILDIPFVGYCIVFGDQYNTHVLTKSDFLEQYKPYKPVYEYKYAYYTGVTECISQDYFLDCEFETKSVYSLFQRLDFTKRERT